MLSVKRITTNLLQALIAFNLTTRPIAISFAIVSEMWDVITLAYYSASNTPSK